MAEGPASLGNNTGPSGSIESWNAGIACAAATKLADESHAPSLVQAITKSCGPGGPGFRAAVRN
jgi:hypothetical protein